MWKSTSMWKTTCLFHANSLIWSEYSKQFKNDNNIIPPVINLIVFFFLFPHQPPIDMNPMLPPQFGRHPMPNNDYDTPMMDLSVSSAMRNHNQQLNHGTLPRSLGFNNVPSCGGGEQDYSTAKPGHIGKDTCDGPVLGANGSNDRRVSMEELEISTRRQNPIGVSVFAVTTWRADFIV